MKTNEKDFEFIVENCKKLGYEINIISKPTTTERKMIENELKLKVMKANEIQLTAEELELIKVAREKKEQEQLAKQKEINDRVDNQKQVAMKAMLIGEQQVKATYDFFKDFTSGEFEIVEYPLKKVMEVKNYTTGDFYFKEDYCVNSAYIQHKETKIKIRVEEHSVGDGWRNKNKGYKMFCSLFEGNRAYSKVSTIEEKVLNEIKSKRAKQNAEEIRNTYIADLIETQPIPNAKIDKTYISSQYVSNPHGIEIKYDNGVVVECNIAITQEGEAILSVYSTRFPKPKLEGETVMDKLNFISKLEF